MRWIQTTLVLGLLAACGSLFAQTAPSSSLPGSSTFSGTHPNYTITVAPGGALSNADITIEDTADSDQVEIQTITPTTTTPTGVTITPSSLPTGLGATQTINFAGTVAASNAPGDYVFTVTYQDDEPLSGTALTITLTITDAAPVASQGAQATVGDGSGGNPFAPATQLTGSTPALALASVADANTGQTLTRGTTTQSGGPTTVFTISDNSPGAGAALVITATAGSALSAADIGTHTFTVDISDGGANNITINLSITVTTNNPALQTPSGLADISLGGTDPNFTGSCTVGDDIAISFQATDADTADTLTTTVSVTSGTLTGATAGFGQSFPFAPTGAVSPHTVSLTGTAANAGTIELTIDVSDGNGGTDQYVITITIAAGNSNPVLQTPSGLADISLGGTDPNFTGSCTVGDDIAISFQATDANATDTLTTTVSVTSGTLTGATAGFGQSFPFAPAGAVSPHTVSLTGTAANAGTIELTIDVSDGNGGTDQYVILITIAAAGTPTINVTASLTAFTSTGIGTPSAQQSYTVAGSNLTADITITPPADFQISTTSGSGFATTPIVLTQAGGTVASTSIFVIYNPTTGGPHAEMIAHTSTGATTQNLNVSGSIAGPAAVAISASGNPGGQNANPGSTKTALGFRLAETGGGSTFTVTSVTVRVTTINNTGGVAIAAISSIALRRGGTVLGTMTSSSWSVAGDVITLNFTGLSSAITASSAADFTLAITFAGTAVPTPRPAFVANITPADVNGGTSVSGATITGGTITLVESLPGDPLDEDKKDDSCNLATEGGPAWPVLFGALIVAFAAVRRRRRTV